MARINVEDDFWTHPRYRYLVRLVGDEDKATGMCLRAWRIAQKFWAKRALIPFEVWDLEGLEHMVTAGLATRREDGVYCRGSKTHFEWYAQRLQASRKGGLKSVETRSEKFGTAQPPGRNLGSKQNRSKDASESKQDRTALQSESNPPALTPALALTSIVSAKAETRPKDAPAPRDLLDLWNAHCGPLPKAKLTAKRTQAVRLRLREESDLAHWRVVIERIASSSFCRGGGSTGWRASFDWLIRPDTHVKVIEGKYDDQGSGGGSIDWSFLQDEGASK